MVGAYVGESDGLVVGSEEGLLVVGTLVGAMVGATAGASVGFSVSGVGKNVTFERASSMLSASSSSSSSELTCFSDGHQKQNHASTGTSLLVELVLFAPSRRRTPLEFPSRCSNTTSLLGITKRVALPSRTSKSVETRILLVLLMVMVFDKQPPVVYYDVWRR